jgi:predicted nucleotidyltransferase
LKRQYLDDAHRSSEARFIALQAALADAEALISGCACVYATGSFGRLEAGPDSDLDLFIVVETHPVEGKGEVRRLNGIDEIKLKYHLISAVDASGIAQFDAGGRYLESHAIEDFVTHLGSQHDDYQNTLTGRLLLLLESRQLLGGDLYDHLLDKVISAYFKDFTGNEDRFAPSFLINDILRLWRTFCVNYEFARKKGSDDIKIKNLKLKFSRMLTCYSAIMYLLSVHVEKNTVSPADVKAMVSLTPVERLKGLQTSNCLISEAERIQFNTLIDNVLGEYSNFLELTHKPKTEVLAAYKGQAGEWKDASYRFGQNFAEALALLGTSRGKIDDLYRMILI